MTSFPRPDLRLVLGLAAALAGGVALAQVVEVGGPPANLQAIGDQQAVVSQSLGEERNRIARLLTALVMFRRDPPPALISSPSEALNAVRAALLAREMAPLLAARAKELAQQEQALALLRRDAAAASADYFTQQSEAAEADDPDAMAALGMPVPDSAVQAPVTTGPAVSPTAAAPGKLSPPITGRLVRGYTPADPGMMFAGTAGSVVTSPAAGRVDYVGAGGPYSVVIILRLADGRHLLLAGLGSASVKAGQQIPPGATLGKLAQSGGNLYMELRQGDQPVDPTPLLQ